MQNKQTEQNDENKRQATDHRNHQLVEVSVLKPQAISSPPNVVVTCRLQ
jgi:hypothetical protein